jgi:hypothetical protein
MKKDRKVGKEKKKKTEKAAMRKGEERKKE